MGGFRASSIRVLEGRRSIPADDLMAGGLRREMTSVAIYGGDDPSSGAIELYRGKTRIGFGRFSLDAHEDAYVDAKLSKKGRKVLRKLHTVTVRVSAGGEVVERELRVVG
jgi:hypothetical protein